MTPPTSAPALRMGPFEWFLLIVLSILWGGSFFFNKLTVAEWPPFAVVQVRVGLAALALLLVVRIAGQSMAVGRELWLAFFGMGILNNLIPFSLFLWGQQQIASGLASILNATTPIFAVLVMHCFGNEKATGLKLGGVLAGLIGVAILMGPDALSGLGSNLAAQLACILAAVSYAFSGLLGRRFRGVSPLVAATGQLSASTLMMIPIVFVMHPPWTLPMPSQQALLALVGLALISTALAYLLFFRIMRTAGPSNVMLVTFLIPVSAILLGSGLLGEELLPRHFAGMAAIFVGLALIDGRIARIAQARPAPTA
ncbi:threonine/homoserine efflux transporter RhtA [Bosea sp. AK1]|uniref:DMT family transporter n=1 Tax=unclassified Bosea (in: a-proteobacteria) TaxID=2653178 RepID=UPI000A90A088|nr:MULTISPECIES: DMT family transporter [unclassified Bosea (in: a-proteobacteria)]TQI76089.1 threonine/homoserine efflux transporter RhtA [Bosea sp. AK1]